MGFVGTINAQQAQVITKAVKTLVQDYLCKSDQVTIESVTYNRNTGEDSTFSAEISCGGKIVPYENFESIINNMSPDTLNQMFPLPLKNEQKTTSTPSAGQQKPWISKNWFVVLGICLAVLLCVSSVMLYTMKKRKSHKKEIQVPSFVQLHDIDGKDTEFQKPIYVSKTDYIDDTNVRL